MYFLGYSFSRNPTYFSWTIVNEHVHWFLRKSDSIELKFIVNIKRNDLARPIFVENTLDRKVHFVSGLLNPIEQLTPFICNL